MDYTQFPITIGLIIANVLFSLAGFNSQPWLNKFIMWPYQVKRKQEYYRFISSGFLHADLMHLFFNMFTLFFFGQAIEYYFKAYGLGGNIAYICLYMTGLIIADLPGYLKHRNDVHYRSLGASGAVSAVLFAAILFNPWNSVYLYGAIKISALLFAVLYIAYCVYMGKKGGDNVNHDAHLWGSVFGAVFTLILIAVMNPLLFDVIIEKLKNPSLFGHG
ncbi:MAG TPA: rhomboid family intramembrane serine protease [Chitinophagaceae bacterium]|nr:rhomboid family intramembrane serine protease [Chitinophagaceae bacterium]HCY89966.1 rhomboid family intramembrane serine protease [Chitinophagaceae bacterium]HRF26005.1 rhomboid family intramembrane serine protease [Ferruginibacter sp.]